MLVMCLFKRQRDRIHKQCVPREGYGLRLHSDGLFLKQKRQQDKVGFQRRLFCEVILVPTLGSIRRLQARKPLQNAR